MPKKAKGWRLFPEVHKRAKKAGQPPGTPMYTGEKPTAPPVITVIHYDADKSIEKVGRLEDSLPPEGASGTIWVNIEGLQDADVISKTAERFHLHPLTVEDILNVEQRPKVEDFDEYVFITLKVIDWHAQDLSFSVNQLSLVVGKNFVLSFQEMDTTLFDTIRERLQKVTQQRLREQGSDYLAYRLIDAVVDDYFVVLEALGDRIEKIESRIISAPKPQNAKSIYRLKRQILMLRKSIWPMREAISHLLHLEDGIFTKFTRIYLRDVYDHTVQAIDTIETFRDILSSMLDMYLSSLTNRMNEIMKTLTIITTIFIPITALGTIYGMNFTYMPGLNWPWSFTIVMLVMAIIPILMVIYFRKKKWI